MRIFIYRILLLALAFLLVPAVPVVALSTAPIELPLDAAEKPSGFSTFNDPVTGITYEAAKEKSFGLGVVFWRIPASTPSGWYWVEFQGNQPGGVTEWVCSSNELEPYRFSVGDSGNNMHVSAFSFAPDPKAGTTIASFRHPMLDIPLTLTGRRSDRPLFLKPGQLLRFESRWDFSLANDFRLVPADAIGAVDVETTTDVPFHLFDETQPPAFTIRITNHGVPFDGEVDLRWLDAIQGDIETATLPVSLPAEGEKDDSTLMQVVPKAGKELPFGAYTLHVQLLDKAGKLLTHQYRNFTYSPRVDAGTLPDDWPFGFNQSPGDSDLILPIGLKHIRLFYGWGLAEPTKGQYKWDDLDRVVEDARRAGSRLLYVVSTTPKWATTHPDNPLHPTAEQRKAGINEPDFYPPENWQDMADFLQAFWQRYAPGGKLDVVDSVEVWNEPNVFFAGTYADYAKMCQVVYETTKKFAPDAKVIGVSQSGGLHGPWVKGVLDAGAGKWMDLASTHNYEIGTPVGAVSIESKVKLIRDALDRNGCTNVGICNTEAGISSWGRWGEKIPDEMLMEKRARSSPYYDPRTPWKIKTGWRTSNEAVSAGEMVRSDFQQVEMGVRPNYYFKWQAGNASWVHDWKEGGNVTPKLDIPVHAVLSEVYKRYGAIGTDPVQIPSPDPKYYLFAHRLHGPEGRVTLIYAYPKTNTLVLEDELVGNAIPNLLPGEPYLTDKANKTVMEPFDKVLFQVTIPGLREGAVKMDILARKQESVAPGQEIGIAQMPIYVIEPNSGGAWPHEEATP